MTRLIPCLAASLLTFSPLALAQPADPPAALAVIRNTPDAVRDLLSSEGYRPELQPGDDQVTASLTLKASGHTLYLYFTDCSEAGCEMVSMDNGFERPEDSAAVAQKLDAWKAKWFTQAYEGTDGVIYLAAPYTLSGGFLKANFLAWFGSYLRDFEQFYDDLY